MKRYKGIIIFIVIVVAALAAAFMLQKNPDSTDTSHQQTDNVLSTADTEKINVSDEKLREPEITENKNENSADEKAKETKEAEDAKEAETAPDNSKEIIPQPEQTDTYEPEAPTDDNTSEKLFMSNRGKDGYETDPVPEGKPKPIEPQDVVISDKELTCTLCVRCDSVFKNRDRFNADKLSVLPSDGVIFAEQTVTFYEGESVFNILLREMKKNKIHFEFEKTPLYNSAYIEGINNIYEFDCGELSGWMYRVNGWFPNYGCSRYQLKEGDRVEILYTCDTGKEFR